MAFITNNNNNYYYIYLMILEFIIVVWGSQSSDAFSTFGFDVHHRYSDPVKGILELDGLPEKGTYDYYAAMAHRDRLIRGRSLSDTVDSAPLIFFDSNETYRSATLGFLHYANVSVGTPSLWFLVALDTGSNLFWLPCDCTSCVRSLMTRYGEKKLNIYSPNISSTSTSVPCNSTFCQQKRRCSSASNACPYQVRYLSSNTSSTGLLVEDVLHLATDVNPLKDVEAPIKFGCGMVQTGSFLGGAAPNGLFGLGMDKVSVPSILASRGLAADSFSMCFGPDGLGRIRFGDKGSSDQSETAFNIDQLNLIYNISMTQISVGDSVTNLNLTAIFDSGTSFTYLADPAYTFISKNFDSLAQEKRLSPNSRIPFDYCYELSENQTSFEVSLINLTMKGGKQFYVTVPVVIISSQGGGLLYCLGLVKSGDINIIGQNFMTGYDIVFDREKMVLGWKASDCYDGNKSTTLPVDPQNSAPPPDASATPAATVEPEARAGNKDGSPIASPPPLAGNHSPRLDSFGYTLLTVFCALFSHYIISS